MKALLPVPLVLALLAACTNEGPTPTAQPAFAGLPDIEFCRSMGNVGAFHYDDGLGAFLIPGDSPLLGCLQQRGWKQAGPNFPAYAYRPPAS